MHFRFLGGLDCPDWLLYEFTVFAKLTSLKFRGVSQLAADYVLTRQLEDSAVEKYVNESLDFATIRSVILIISEWLLKKPAGQECSGEDLEKETIQLGLPIEHGKMLRKIYETNLPSIQGYIRSVFDKEPHGEIIDIERSGSNHIILLKRKEDLKKIEVSNSCMENLKLELSKALAEMDRYV